MERSGNVVWNSVGITVYNLASPLLMILVTRFGANKISDAGVFSLAYSSSMIIFAIAAFGTRAYQVTDTDGRYQSGEYAAARLFTCAAALLSAAVFALLSRYGAEKAAVFVLLAATRSAEGFGDVYHGMLQKRGRLDVAGKALLLKASLGIVFFAAALIPTKSVVAACFAQLLVSAAVLLLYERRWAYRTDSPKLLYSARRLYALLAACFPLFAVSAIAPFLQNIPRYAVDQSMTEADLGIYGILFMQGTIICLLAKFMLQPAYTVFAARFAAGERRGFFRAVARLLAAICAGTVVLEVLYYFFGVRLLRALFGQDLSGYLRPLLTVLAGAALFSLSVICFAALTALRANRIQLSITLACALLGLCIAGPLVSRYGIAGATAAFALMMLFQSLAAGAALFRQISRMPPVGAAP